MNLVISSKNYNISGFIKSELEQKIDKFAKYLTEDASVTVLLKGEKNQLKKVEITIRMRNNVLRSEVGDFDIRTAIDKSLDKIERQLIKHKEKLIEKVPDSIRYDSDRIDESSYSRIVRNKTFSLRPMNPEEACFQLELLEHSFYVFLNEATNKVSVVYKRNDGDYGLIEPEK
ncbi:MAG: ribosome-associated translation inhibitor RaiA [Eubacteriaceae bacterium]|nr:ribosome-associated translation inhibitor RaiA [Eubacteriaceae bacterium]